MRPRHCDSLTVVVVGSLKFRHLYGLLFTCISVHPSIWLLFSSSFFQILPTTQLIREITEAKTQKWTLPPKDMSLKIERVSRAKFETNFCSKNHQVPKIPVVVVVVVRARTIILHQSTFIIIVDRHTLLHSIPPN